MCIHCPRGMALLHLAFFCPAAAGCYTTGSLDGSCLSKPRCRQLWGEEKGQLFAVIRANNHTYRCAQQCVCCSPVIRRVGQAAPVTISPSRSTALSLNTRAFASSSARACSIPQIHCYNGCGELSSLQFTLAGTERDSSSSLVTQMADKNRICPARLSETEGGVSNFIYRDFFILRSLASTQEGSGNMVLLLKSLKMLKVIHNSLSLSIWSINLVHSGCMLELH